MSRSALRLGRYWLQDQIGAGGMGEVWRGVDTVLERPVAVKLLRAEYARQAETVARFRCEARHASSSVIRPSPWFMTTRTPVLPPAISGNGVGRWAVARMLAAGRRVDPARTMDVIAQTAAGLDAAHRAGLVHRDIKPANLLLDRHGRVKITDFGVADAVGSAPVTGTAIVGTPAYVAPERLAGAPAAPASDLYSSGSWPTSAWPATYPSPGRRRL